MRQPVAQPARAHCLARKPAVGRARQPLVALLHLMRQLAQASGAYLHVAAKTHQVQRRGRRGDRRIEHLAQLATHPPQLRIVLGAFFQAEHGGRLEQAPVHVVSGGRVAHRTGLQSIEHRRVAIQHLALDRFALRYMLQRGERLVASATAARNRRGRDRVGGDAPRLERGEPVDECRRHRARQLRHQHRQTDRRRQRTPQCQRRAQNPPGRPARRLQARRQVAVLHDGQPEQHRQRNDGEASGDGSGDHGDARQVTRRPNPGVACARTGPASVPRPRPPRPRHTAAWCRC